MSVKTDYENLKVNRAHVQESLEKEREDLTKIQNSYRELLSKKDELSEYSSKLVKPLLRKISREIRKFKLKSSKSSETVRNLESELAELEKNIALLNDDISFYVQEQTDYMVTELLDYVSTNSSNLAYNIKTDFCICNETERVPYKSNSHFSYNPNRYYTVNTANLAISQGTTLIAISKDFYFKKVFLYDTDFDGEGNIVVIYTDWFKEYLTTFKATLKSKVENAFKGNKDFRVVFQDDSKFTLELI